ncbi:MAG: TonB family protein [Candidatus Methylomirabilota bacterium]
MAAAADRFFAPGQEPREVWLTFGLSVLVHGLLTATAVLIPHFQVGTYITVPVTYTVSLVSAPPGGGSPAPPPAILRPPAPAQVAPAPTPRAAPAPRPAPTEELTLPGRRPATKPAPEREPSLRPPPVTGKETVRPAPPTPIPSAPAAPPVPQPVAPVASAGAGTGTGTTSGVEVAVTASGAGSGAGAGPAGSSLASYLTLVDWKIQQNWTPLGTPGLPETVVVVRFRVLRSGQVRDIALETTSGSASLDASALRAVRQSLPLPPFPNLLTEPWLDLRYRFVMERG